MRPKKLTRYEKEFNQDEEKASMKALKLWKKNEAKRHSCFDSPYYYHVNAKHCPVCGRKVQLYRRIGGEAKMRCGCGTIIGMQSAAALRKWWNRGGWQYMKRLVQYKEDKALYSSVVTNEELQERAHNLTAYEQNFVWADREHCAGEKGVSFSLIAKWHESDTSSQVFVLRAIGYTEAAKDAFVQGFIDNTPNNYDFEADKASEAPWCTPWTYDDPEAWFNYSYECPYIEGAKWADYCYEDLEQAF